METTIPATGSNGATAPTSPWVSIARELGPRFAERAPAHDDNDSFVAENYAEMREAKFFSAAVPAELGGGGASYAEICAVVRELAHHCGSAYVGVAEDMEVTSGSAFFRGLGLERRFRDIQGVRYHPLQARKQAVFSGRIALGLDPV